MRRLFAWLFRTGPVDRGYINLETWRPVKGCWLDDMGSRSPE